MSELRLKSLVTEFENEQENNILGGWDRLLTDQCGAWTAMTGCSAKTLAQECVQKMTNSEFNHK